MCISTIVTIVTASIIITALFDVLPHVYSLVRRPKPFAVVEFGGGTGMLVLAESRDSRLSIALFYFPNYS